MKRYGIIAGAAAFANCSSLEDDLDLFIITRKNRLWLAYTTLALRMKFRNRRRKLCLNYLVSEQAAERHLHHFYVAHQIAHVRPVLNRSLIRESGNWLIKYSINSPSSLDRWIE